MALPSENPPPGIRLGVRLGVVGNAAQRADVVSRLTATNVDCVEIPVDRTMVDRLLACEPDVAVIAHARNEFDVVRVCRDVRSVVEGGLLVVSDASADNTELEVALIEAGADDVMGIDTSARLLRARAARQVRAQPATNRISRIEIGDVVIDLEGHDVSIGGESVACPHRIFRLLVLLARQPNTVVTREQVAFHLWGIETAGYPRKGRVVVSALRKVLGSGEQRPTIEAVAKTGYRLTVPDGVEYVMWRGNDWRDGIRSRRR